MAADWLEVSERLGGKVDLEITGGQGDITTKHVADCYFRNGSFYLLFEENIAEDGKKGRFSFSSRLKISEDRVVLKRSMKGRSTGDPGHTMEVVYEKRGEGERGSRIEYPTPYGKIHLEIQTQELQVTCREEILEAKIGYLLLQEGMEADRDVLQIRITKT